MEGYQQGSGRGRGGGKVQRISSMVENRQGEGKNSVGNVEVKELIGMTHGHELKERNAGRRGCAGQRGIKEGEWGKRYRE